MGTFLYNVIVPHGTSDFADIILARKLTAEDGKDVQFEKAYELLKCMKY